MILHRVALENFRQFYGRQELVLYSPADGDRTVTVIFGENGRGKTGVFRAVIFCLFGERRLSQDGDVHLHELQLVNTMALEMSPEQPVRTSVEIEFSHRGETFRLRRAIKGMRNGGEVIEEVDEVRLHVTGVDGNTRSVNPSDIDRVIASIIDPRVKDYFLFDGEKIERLTRASVEQRQEISRGIRNLLNVDALESAIKAMKRVTDALAKEVSATASVELSRLLSRLGENEQEQGRLSTNLEELDGQIRSARKEIEETDKRLDEIREIRHLLVRRRELDDQCVYLRQQVTEQLAEMKGYTSKAAQLLLAAPISAVYEYIDSRRKRGEIPSEIRRDLIEKILAERECICGNPVCEGSIAHQKINEWRKKTSDVVVQDAALDLWRYLGEVRVHFGDIADEIEKRLLKYGNTQNDLTTALRNLQSIREQIGAEDRPDATRLDEMRKSLEEGIISLEADARGIQARLDQLVQAEEQLKAQLKEEKKKVGRSNELNRRRLLAREALDALTEVHREFTEDIKREVGATATQLFQLLLDKQDRGTLKAIVVKADYSLQVEDRYGRPFLANISAGQRQVMSIAFIAALAKAASRDDIVEVPLFMDTPFGRLSDEHRINLIEHIPGLSSQWVLLATDTEFRVREAQLLKGSGKWGHFIMLRSTSDGCTRVEERQISDAMALLRKEEEL